MKPRFRGKNIFKKEREITCTKHLNSVALAQE